MLDMFGCIMWSECWYVSGEHLVGGIECVESRVDKIENWLIFQLNACLHILCLYTVINNFHLQTSVQAEWAVIYIQSFSLKGSMCTS